MAGIFAGGLGGFLGLVLGGFSAGARNFFAGYPRAVVDPSDPHGYYTQYSPGVRIRGTPEYQATVVRDLNTVRSTEAGRYNLDRIDSSGQTTTIRAPANQAELDRGNTCRFNPNTAYQNPDGSAGSGSDSEVIYNPDRQQVGDGSEDWMTRPPDVGLHHELEHSAEAANGTMETGTTDINGQETANVETQSVGLGHNADNPGSENAYRRERGQPQRPRY
jgi:type VI secretion system secreted protein VgrG